MELTFLHIVIMLVTVMVVIGGGIYAARSVKSAEGYSLGGRNAGVTLVAGSIAGTVVGGGATVGTAQMAFTLGLPLGLVLLSLLWACFMQNLCEVQDWKPYRNI